MSRQTRRGLIIIGLLIIPFAVGLLITFQVIRIPVPTDMASQPSIGYQELPRKYAPGDAVPLQGVQLVADRLPTNPIESDGVSLQRGQILFTIHCALCHGLGAQGDGKLADRYDQSPPDLTGSNIGAQFDGGLYLIISDGLPNMPALSNNLTPRERWDVINYLRTLEQE